VETKGGVVPEGERGIVDSYVGDDPVLSHFPSRFECLLVWTR